MSMTSLESRDLLLDTLKSLKGLCRAIAQESKHIEEGCMWKGKPYTVAWQLEFDDERLEFEPQSMVMPGERPASPELLELEERIRSRLKQLKVHEEWPASIPPEWLGV